MFTAFTERREALGRHGHAQSAQAVVSLPSVRTAKLREPDSPRLSRGSPRGDCARLPRTRASCAASRARIARLSCHRVQLDQKKGVQLPPLPTTLLAADPGDPTSTTLELDELWSFVLKKAKEVWVWIALCRNRRQVVAYAVGDRSKKTCQRLWESIADNSCAGHCETSFWAAYQAVIAEEQHTAVGKEAGETAHVERWKNTHRPRLARFVRMTLSFSKSVMMLRPRVCFSFSIAPIESGPSCSSEPLPSNEPPPVFCFLL
jgi:insertion element IS1 protein InsB